MEPDYIYVEHVISVLAVIHALLSFCMVIAYYNLKVPLGIFIREKEVGRRLEFEGLYIKEKPEDDDMKAHWDSIVISSKSFPNLYWDKFIKKRVRQKYAEEFDFDQISNILGMEKSAVIPKEGDDQAGFMGGILDVDWRYQGSTLCYMSHCAPFLVPPSHWSLARILDSDWLGWGHE